MAQVSLLERACELVSSGQCPGFQALKATLRAEGYSEVDAQFAEQDLRHELLLRLRLKVGEAGEPLRGGETD